MLLIVIFLSGCTQEQAAQTTTTTEAVTETTTTFSSTTTTLAVVAKPSLDMQSPLLGKDMRWKSFTVYVYVDNTSCSNYMPEINYALDA